jgi:protocatechuate 3,4-dioxygenase beta subunit
MNDEVRLSRLRISRRRALSLGGTVGLAGVLAACGASGDGSPVAPATPTAEPAADATALLDAAGTCRLSPEQTQGPYWFDVDSIRSDIREDRPGLPLVLALRVQDVSACSGGGAATPVANSVVEIWHCDAGGVYSGFESASRGRDGGPPPGGPPPSRGPGGGPGGPPPSGTPGSPNPAGGEGPDSGGRNASGETSNGSYSVGDREAATSDDGTYLRGAQVADANGIVRFTTIYPGWYAGRTTHIHCKVHIDKKTVLTTQLFFDDALNDEVYTVPPYAEHTGRDTRNDDDSIYDAAGLVTTRRSADGYLAAINLGIDV